MAFKLNPFTSQLDTVRNQILWGSFYDTTDQVAALANTDYAITINTTDPDSNGISIASNSRITFSRSGVYSITYSIQFTNSDSQIHDTNIWLRKNDSGSTGDVAASDSKFSIIASHGGVAGNVIGCVNYVLKLAANDYLELIWSTTNVAASIQSMPAAVSGPAHPSVPGIIVTAVQVA
ncbi:MAG: hypothetical protein EBY66_00890 [Candidatus Fonsibacter lacus]|nr:hypothetical protein [Candidatus Fonsibacter lacus]